MARGGGRPLGVTRPKTARHPPKRTDEQKESHRKTERYRRRKRSVVKKCKELNDLCKAKVFLLVVDEMCSHVFTSERLSALWPPSISKLLDSSVKDIHHDTSNGNLRLEIMPEDQDLVENESVASASLAGTDNALTNDSYPVESPAQDISRSAHLATSSVE